MATHKPLPRDQWATVRRLVLVVSAVVASEAASTVADSEADVVVVAVAASAAVDASETAATERPTEHPWALDLVVGMEAVTAVATGVVALTIAVLVATLISNLCLPVEAIVVAIVVAVTATVTAIADTQDKRDHTMAVGMMIPGPDADTKRKLDTTFVLGISSRPQHLQGVDRKISLKAGDFRASCINSSRKRNTNGESDYLLKGKHRLASTASAITKSAVDDFGRGIGRLRFLTLLCCTIMFLASMLRFTLSFEPVHVPLRGVKAT